MPYDLEQFITDCRSSLGRDPSPTGREQVRVNLERLLTNKDFIEKYCGDDAPRGLNVLYEDPRIWLPDPCAYQRKSPRIAAT